MNITMKYFSKAGIVWFFMVASSFLVHVGGTTYILIKDIFQLSRNCGFRREACCFWRLLIYWKSWR